MTTAAQAQPNDPAPRKKRGRASVKIMPEVPERRPQQIAAVISSAEKSGLLGEKSGRIAGRISATLIAEAKARTGLTSDTELVEFALANIALEDDFAETFRSLKGTVDPSLDLGF